MFLLINGKVIVQARESPTCTDILVLLVGKIRMETDDFMQLKMFIRRQRRRPSFRKKSSVVSSFLQPGVNDDCIRRERF